MSLNIKCSTRLLLMSFLHNLILLYIAYIVLFFLGSTQYLKSLELPPTAKTVSNTWKSWCLSIEYGNSGPKGEARRTLGLWTSSRDSSSYCWWTKSCTSWYGSLSQYLQGFVRPRWCRISSINSMSLSNWLACSSVLLLVSMGASTLQATTFWNNKSKSYRVFQFIQALKRNPYQILMLILPRTAQHL